VAVGALSVVLKGAVLEADGVYVGAPARRIRERAAAPSGQ